MTLYDLLQAKFPQNEVLYVEEGHRYSRDGEPYESSSNFCKQFYPEFDAKSVADEMVAKGHKKAIGKTSEQLQEEWLDNGSLAAGKGTILHTHIEAFSATDGSIEMQKHHLALIDDPEIKVRFEKFLQLYRTRLYKLKLVAKEFMVFNHRYKKAGRLDAIYEAPTHPLIAIPGDWKSNKKFTKDWAFGYLNPPMPMKPASHLHKYSIQLSFYCLLLNLAGIQTHWPFIGHFPPDGKRKKFQGELIMAVDYREEIHATLEREYEERQRKL